MAPENPRFGKVILPGSERGSIVIRDEDTGSTSRLRNPIKEKSIPAVLLDNLASVVIEAFPSEFQGSDGQTKEHDLLKKVKAKYPNEQPNEIAGRTVATLAGMGIEADEIASALLARSKEFKLNLNLANMSKTEKNDKLAALREAVISNWPSADR